MEWFMSRTIFKLPGAFETSFWTVLLPQACVSEPAVLHATLSLASIHKRQALGLKPGAVSAGLVESDLFALRQYTRAMTDLRHRIGDDSRRSADVALITCAAFVQLEYLRGCYQAGLTHLRHGLTVLEMNLRREPKRMASQHLVNEWIIRIFCTMTIQAKLFGQDVCRPELFLLLSEQLKPPDRVFRSVNEARRSLEAIFLRIMYQNSRSAAGAGYPGTADSSPSSDSSGACADSISNDLELWLQMWQRGLGTCEKPAVLSPAIRLDRFARKLLPIYHSLAGVLHLRTATLGAVNGNQDFSSMSSLSDGWCSAGEKSRCDSNSGTETPDSMRAEDPITTAFRSIINDCEVLFKMAMSPTVQASRIHQYDDIVADASQAIADIGWIPILYSASIYCHDPIIRSRAIEMFRLIPHREGIWDSSIAVIIAEKFLEIEHERSKFPGSIVLDPARMQIELPDSPSGQLVLRCIDQEARRRDPRAPEEKYIYAMDLNRWLERGSLSRPHLHFTKETGDTNRSPTSSELFCHRWTQS
ncbi:hypothetical protein B0A52_09888 [Exophiala mesophila]|uniref:Transcription factor domain-containing protein n=1 Tax=Exophiala mesophila TaxID=212818 RepID=A0A438MRC3_EXOME|nr:hypothetical protein B0A52_09888 [Exophiala mesophila]